MKASVNYGDDPAMVLVFTNKDGHKLKIAMELKHENYVPGKFMGGEVDKIEVFTTDTNLTPPNHTRSSDGTMFYLDQNELAETLSRFLGVKS